MLKVIEYIKSHKNWEDDLAQSPYCISVSKDNMYGRNLALLKYNQISSDFNNEIVRECRGLIIDIDSLEPVSVPFYKFGNYGESYCPEIDWKSAKITQKIDGSLIKIVRLGNDLLISTNGTIDASKAEVSQNLDFKYSNYKELIENAEPLKSISKDKWLDLFEENYTYMFELISPYNKVVIPYEGINLCLIGVRNNKSLEEILIYDHPLAKIFKTPKQYGFKSLDECILAANELPYTEEGYVVVDKNFNRVKVKSPSYVAVHHLKGQGILTPKKAMILIVNNEIDEFLNYFSEYKLNIQRMLDGYHSLINAIDDEYNSNIDYINSLESRKDKAQYILKNCKFSNYMFKAIDNKYDCAMQYISDLTYDKLADMVEDFIKNA